MEEEDPPSEEDDWDKREKVECCGLKVDDVAEWDRKNDAEVDEAGAAAAEKEVRLAAAGGEAVDADDDCPSSGEKRSMLVIKIRASNAREWFME
jgi:hypothetical protein